MALAFVVNSLDRRANERTDAAWLAAQLAAPAARLVQLGGDAVLLEGGQLVTRMEPVELEATVFLGVDGEGTPWFAREVKAGGEGTGHGVAGGEGAGRGVVGGEGAGRGVAGGEGGGELRDLRGLALAEALPPEQLGILAQARALLAWHGRHRFCSVCGTATVASEAGYRRHCSSCNADHFPRTDPVAIIAVHHQGSVLLGRQRGWRRGMYSALAGFLEPGETIEDAARREVFEESGIVVGEVRYVASQPWPFPGSLMIGLIGEARTTEICLDEKELEDARWFGAEEARTMVERTHPQGLFAANPMAIAHHLVRIALGLDGAL